MCAIPSSHGAGCLTIERRLTRIYGHGHPYPLTGNPNRAVRWHAQFQFGEFVVDSSFTLWYESHYKPTDNLGVEVDASQWTGSDSEIVHGDPNLGELMDLLEAGIEQLKSHTPQSIAEIKAIFDSILHHAYEVPA